MALHNGNIVEEVSTKRRGKISSTRPTCWGVQFFDGNKLASTFFMNEAGLRLVTCPHQGSDPGFVLGRGIMGWWNRLRGRR